jgi:cell filamentation protein
MIKTKYLLYAFKSLKNGKYQYWYRTDDKYFLAEKPPASILKSMSDEASQPTDEDIIDNPWQEWSGEDIQKIISGQGVCINYLATTDSDIIQRQEDFRLLEVYDDIVCNFDISKSFGFEMVRHWHKEIFKNIYPFAGELRTVEMSKGDDDEHWVWRKEFLKAIPQLDNQIKKVVDSEYKDDVKSIAYDLSVILSDFLFIHPFREGNGRISRLLSDVVLAKNGFPMVGLNLKKGDNYIQRVHAGYETNYEPLAELLEQKIEERIKNG